MNRSLVEKNRNGKRKTTVLIALVLIMTLIAGICISGCGKSSEMPEQKEAAYDQAVGEGYGDQADYVEGKAAMAEGEPEAANGEQPELTEGSGTKTGQKLITNWNISVETEKYDDFMKALRKNVKERGGYIQSEDESSGSYGCRNICLTIRIPEEKADSWVTDSTELGTITSKSKSQRDVTLDYIDTESRLSSLKTERKSLNRLLEKADSMEDILTIQGRIQEVNYQIESYESQLRYLQNDISYATVDMYVTEVKRESDTGTGLGSRIREEFADSLSGVKDFGEGILVFLLGGAPVIITLLVIAAVIIFLIRRWKKRRADKKMGKLLCKKDKKAHVIEETDGQNGEDTLN